VKEVLSRGLFVTTLTALIGIPATGISAAGASQLWSVVVHIEYDNGFVYEHAFATGVPTSTLPSILEECGTLTGGTSPSSGITAIPYLNDHSCTVIKGVFRL
jgi:hypothetical protein